MLPGWRECLLLLALTVATRGDGLKFTHTPSDDGKGKIEIDEELLQKPAFIGLKKGDDVVYGDMVGVGAQGKPSMSDDIVHFLVRWQ